MIFLLEKEKPRNSHKGYLMGDLCSALSGLSLEAITTSSKPSGHEVLNRSHATLTHCSSSDHPNANLMHHHSEAVFLKL